MRLGGAPYAPRSAREAIRAGAGLLPEDRKAEGLVLGQSLRDNAALTLRAFAAALRRPTAGDMGPRALDARLTALDVRAASFDIPVRALSGGNQQKVVVARCLARDPQLLIFAEPTRGVDVAAKASIYAIMRDLAARGRAIVMVSSDLPEIVGVSDRIVVMRDGRIVGEALHGASEEDVMALAVGHAQERVA
jgi:ribose transport system ATP-binding protein